MKKRLLFHHQVSITRKRGVKWTSSHIKVYRRPLALGDFVESFHVLTHILTRGQVTLFDYYNRSHSFGVWALSSCSCLRTTSMEYKNLLVWEQWWEREKEKISCLHLACTEARNPAVCVFVCVCMCVCVCCVGHGCTFYLACLRCIALMHKTRRTDLMTEWTWVSV